MEISILLYILAGIFLLQSLFTVVLFFVLNPKMKQLEDKAIHVTQRSAGQVRNLRALVVRMGRAIEILPRVEESVTKVLDLASEKVQTVDQLAESVLRESATRIEEAGRKIEMSLKKFHRQAAHVERLIRNPVVNASALLQGVVVGFRQLFQSNRTIQPATHSPEDDAFI